MRTWVRAVATGIGVTVASVALLSASAIPVLDPAGSSRGQAAEASDGPRPNIVLVLTDDMRVDDLRFMPRVRRLMIRHGLVFRNAFSPYPLCCPARVSILTGLYPHNHGVLSNLPPWGFGAVDDRATIATSLQDAGYRTGFVGKYVNGYGTDRSLVTGGPSLRYVPAGWDDWYASVEPPPGSGIEGSTYDYFNTVFNVNGRLDRGHRGEYQTSVVGQFARRLLTTYAAQRKPFFLWLSALAPHTGFPREPDDDAFVRGASGRLVRLSSPARPGWVIGRFDRMVQRPPGVPLAGGSPEPDVEDKPREVRRPPLSASEVQSLVELTRQRAEALYVLDRQIGKLVSALKETAAWPRTVIVFTSDNGYFLGEHRLRFAKTLPYEPALRVPLLVSGAGVPTGRRFDPATLPDLAATILDLAHAEPPVPPDGASLLPVIRSGDRGWTRPVVTEAVVPLRGRPVVPQFTDGRTLIGIRTARYSYLRWASGAVELYDLLRDPNELTNLADVPSYAEVRRRLARVWREFGDCRASGCTRAMPEVLQVAATELAALTRRQAHGIHAAFGTSW